MTKAMPQYNRAAMKYREDYYSLLMPCGPLEDTQAEGDDAPII